MTTISPEKMTIDEKILGMEALWQDLCQHNLVESPDWHEFVLSSRQAKKRDWRAKSYGLV